MRYPFAFFFLSASLYSCSTDEPPHEVAALDTLVAEQVAVTDSSSDPSHTVPGNTTYVHKIPFELIAQEAEDLNVIRTCLARYEPPSVYRSIAASGVARVKGVHGLEIAVNPDDFETETGEPVDGEIDIEIKEALSQTQFLRNGITTLSNGKLLVSGGAYFVNATVDGTQLRLKKGRSIAMKLPRITDSSMSLFYGNVSASGEINWLESEKNSLIITKGTIGMFPL